MMTKPLDPEIKQIRALVRSLDALPDDRTETRVLEWLIARRLHEPHFTLPLAVSKRSEEALQTATASVALEREEG
jgi:hypothetical protein